MIDKPLYQNPLGGGFETSFGLLDSNPDREKQYFYNKDLNKLFNMPMGVRMAAPKGFESVNKDQYEDYANKGATLQGANMFNDSMGGGYNLDLPRDQFGSIDRTSSEYDYFYGDNQQKPNIGAGILGTYMPSQEEGLEHLASNIPLNNFPGNPNYLERSVQPIVSGPETFETATVTGANLPDLPPMFATPGLPPQQEETPGARDLIETIGTVKGPEDTLLGVANNPYNRVGQQLTGPNQDDILGTLKNIEQGIASLGQGGMNKSSFGGFNNNFGIGSFFPPYGGMYG